MVVASAIRTIIAKSLSEITPSDRPMLRTISSINPRVQSNDASYRVNSQWQRLFCKSIERYSLRNKRPRKVGANEQVPLKSCRPWLPESTQGFVAPFSLTTILVHLKLNEPADSQL